MKKMFFILAFCLLLSIPCAAITNTSFHYESSELGFSLTLPCENEKTISVEENENRVDFFHEPSREKYGGLIGSIEVVSPRSEFFAEHYDDMLIFWRRQEYSLINLLKTANQKRIGL